MKTRDVQRLLDRRRRLLHLFTIGMKVTPAVDKICEEFHCARSTVWHDWDTKNEWIPLLLKLGPEYKDEVIMDTLASIHEAKQEAYNTSLTVEGMPRVAALRLYEDTIKDEIKIRQTLGLLPREPLKIQHRIVMLQGKFVKVDSNGKIVDTEVSKPALPSSSGTAIVSR